MLARVVRRQVVCLASRTRKNRLNEPGEDFNGIRARMTREWVIQACMRALLA